eukprot:jgi/Astpho2/2772/gw1.00050.23.1_t
MLSQRVQGRHISGIIVMNAHRVTETSGEGFAIRLYRIANRTGFLRAVSDQPTVFSAGFSRLERVMKSLFLRRLFIWPRYEAGVKSTLEGHECELIEMSLRLTPSMSAIYEAITDLLTLCLAELKKSRNIDTSDMNIEQGLFKSFDDMVRRQMDAVWHTAPSKVKQLADDLRTLRTLGEYLLRLDGVTFLSYLEDLRASEGPGSIWLFLDPAHTVFEQAGSCAQVLCRAGCLEMARPRRVYALKSGRKRSKPNNGKAGTGNLDATLEPLPKWGVLLELLQEARAEFEGSREAETVVLDQSDEEGQEAAPPKPSMLVIAEERLTCIQLQACLRAGTPEALMQQLFDDYLLRRLDRKGNMVKLGARPGSSAAGSGSGRGTGRGGGRGGGRQHFSERCVSAAHAGRKHAQQGAISKGAGKAAGKGKGTKQREGGQRRTAKKQAPPAFANGAALPDMQSTSVWTWCRQVAAANGQQSTILPEAGEQNPLLRMTAFYALESNHQTVLWDVRPDVVIMYDPDMACIRQLEVYQAERLDKKIKVFHLVYEDSFEADKFMAGVDREASAALHSNIIKRKEVMALPNLAEDLAYVSPLCVVGEGICVAGSLLRGRANRRAEPKRLIVDMREFMSHLPAVLHQQGLEIVPVTLEVADYILSPGMCVERKAVPDLRQSLNSGRLFSQAEAMVRHYELPVLLIEFEEDKAFRLFSENEVTDRISQYSFMSKVCLLVLHFPKLRILWSKSLHATAEMFRDFKSNQDEPEAEVAASIGIPPGAGEVNEAGTETIVNQTALDVLRRLPGVSEAMVRPLEALAPSICDLAQCPKEQLRKAMGSESAATQLFEFLHAVCPVV